MAQYSNIQNLPIDALRAIMIRVAGPPNGATDIARTFAVSPIFQNFSEDEQILKAVTFLDLSEPDFDKSGIRKLEITSRYERFEQVGGLLLRCAEAKNPEAEFLLAKVIMVVGSKLYDAGKIANSDQSRLEKSRNFLEQFSSDTANDLVLEFLSKAEISDLFEMKLHLKDYVNYNLKPGTHSAYEMFLTSMDDFDEAFSRIALTSVRLPVFVQNFNGLCEMAHSIFRFMDSFEEEDFRPLLESLLQMNDQVRPETLLQRLSVIEPILELGDQLAAEESPDVRLIIDNICEAAFLLKLNLSQYMQARFFLQNAHSTLASDFGDLFYD